MRGIHTFNMLDFPSTKAGECALVLGARDARRNYRAMNINNRGPNGGPPFSDG
jgi:hypothetical protein